MSWPKCVTAVPKPVAKPRFAVPSIANTNPATTVIFPVLVIIVVTALAHGLPDNVRSGSLASMFCIAQYHSIARQTPARFALAPK